MDIQKKMKSLAKELIKANEEYYINDNPSLTDNEYDSKFRLLKELEIKYPEYKDLNSPTNRVGSDKLEKFEKVEHTVPMMSLMDVFSYEELSSFDQRVRKEIKDVQYVCELKIDGLSVSLEYENGILIRASTRGDGSVGENILENVKTIKSIPIKLEKNINITIRGEIYMSKSTLEKLNVIRKENNESLLLNVRNAAAGSIRQLDSKVCAKRNLETFLYNLANYEDFSINKHSDALEYISKLGFAVNENNVVVDTIEEVFSFINNIAKIRDTLPYEIDGIVIKINNFKDQNKLGLTHRYPKWAAAYKFPATEVITKLNDIIFTVGRTGQITPNAVLEPVLIMGSLVSRATLHNEDYIIAKDLKVNDYVVVRKAGDVIPEVVCVKQERRSGIEKNFSMIKECPICSSKLTKVEGKIDLFCINKVCPARKIESLIHFASKDAMNIENMGPEIIEELFNEGILTKYVDFYLLKDNIDKIIEIEGFGDTLINKLVSNIELSKKNSLERLIFGLGIPGIGKKKAKELAEEYKDIEELIRASEDDISNIENFGSILASNVVKYFKDNMDIINSLRELSINTKYLGTLRKNSSFITGKTFVITGSFLNYSRDDIKNIIESYSGKVTSSVSKKTDYVIVGSNAGSKLNKAVDLKIDLINEENLQELLTNNMQKNKIVI